MNEETQEIKTEELTESLNQDSKQEDFATADLEENQERSSFVSIIASLKELKVLAQNNQDYFPSEENHQTVMALNKALYWQEKQENKANLQ